MVFRYGRLDMYRILVDDYNLTQVLRMKTTEKKKVRRGGNTLLEKHGPDYFRKLRAKQTKLHSKAVKEWRKKHSKTI